MSIYQFFNTTTTVCYSYIIIKYDFCSMLQVYHDVMQRLQYVTGYITILQIPAVCYKYMVILYKSSSIIQVYHGLTRLGRYA